MLEVEELQQYQMEQDLEDQEVEVKEVEMEHLEQLTQVVVEEQVETDHQLQVVEDQVSLL
jgi:hypothetical protein